MSVEGSQRSTRDDLAGDDYEFVGQSPLATCLQSSNQAAGFNPSNPKVRLAANTLTLANVLGYAGRSSVPIALGTESWHQEESWPTGRGGHSTGRGGAYPTGRGGGSRLKFSVSGRSDVSAQRSLETTTATAIDLNSFSVKVPKRQAEDAIFEQEPPDHMKEALVEEPATGVPLESLTMQGLRARCKENGLKVAGKKSELIARLQQHSLETILQPRQHSSTEDGSEGQPEKMVEHPATNGRPTDIDWGAADAAYSSDHFGSSGVENESAGQAEEMAEELVTGRQPKDIDWSALDAAYAPAHSDSGGVEHDSAGQAEKMAEELVTDRQPTDIDWSALDAAHATDDSHTGGAKDDPAKQIEKNVEQPESGGEQLIQNHVSTDDKADADGHSDEKGDEDTSAGQAEKMVEQPVTGIQSIDIDLSSMTVLDLKAKTRDLFRHARGQQREILGFIDFAIARLEEDVGRLLHLPVTEEISTSIEKRSVDREDVAKKRDVFVTQHASGQEFDMEARLKDIRWDILPPKRNLNERTHRSSRQYLFSNEGEPYFWREAMDKLGGVMIGVGSEQNYLMAGWAKPELLILMDLNPAISHLHKAYRVGFELGSTPDEFIKLWGDAEGIERMSSEAIEIYGDSQDGEDVIQMITGHPAIAQGLIGLCLRKLKEKYDNLGIPCYLNNQEQYSHIRNLYKTGRVLPILGDLTGTKTMNDVSSLARDAGLPIRVLYISNAMYQIAVNMFDVPLELLERFRDNILGLPFDEESLVLHTVQSSAQAPGGMKVTGKNLVRQAYMSQALGQNAPLPSEREAGKSWIFHKSRGVEFQEWLETGRKRREEEARIKAEEG